jgi:hypothetical protein
MVGVAAFWPDALWISAHPGGPKRWLSEYIFAMQGFGADTLHMIACPPIDHGYDIGYCEHPAIEDAIEMHPGATVVVLDPEAPVALKDYTHPEEALYIVGNDYGGVPELACPVDRVRIEGQSPILWSHNCISIVLYDRWIKSGGN